MSNRGVTIDISLDAGLNQVPVNATGESITINSTGIYSGNRGTYTWVIPDSINDPNSGFLYVVSDSCMITIYDPYSQPKKIDWSSTFFSIRN